MTESEGKTSKFGQKLVGMTGFEPAASCSQSRRSTKLSHIPIDFGYNITVFNLCQRKFFCLINNNSSPATYLLLQCNYDLLILCT